MVSRNLSAALLVDNHNKYQIAIRIEAVVRVLLLITLGVLLCLVASPRIGIVYFAVVFIYSATEFASLGKKRRYAILAREFAMLQAERLPRDSYGVLLRERVSESLGRLIDELPEGSDLANQFQNILDEEERKAG
jgi:hypothetical protein